jgi:membrane associated rhomboid family serine protease
MESIRMFPVTFLLIAANVLFSFMAFNNADVQNKAIMWPYGVKRNRQYYRFITSGFIHADYMHLFFNMFTLYFFGRVIELYFSGYELGGKIAYLLLYAAALVISDLPTYLKQKDNAQYHSLGASGAVSALVFAAVIFNPWSLLYLFGAVPVPAIVYAVLYIIYCIYMSRRNTDNINHDAHLWGGLFGLAYTLLLIGIKNAALFEPLLHRLVNPKF